jgi:hypothetical protein
METTKYVRKSFDVEAIRVTEENMKEIAEWCKGTVETPHALSVESDPFINVRVRYPLTPRQTQAFVGEWVLYSGTGFKVYTDSAVKKHFVGSESGNVTVTNVFVNNPEAITPSELTEAVRNQDAITGKR